jgi:uncharacterized membrane protein YeaQ/YmgE (transglycosylase-associated protein family)
MPTDNLLVLILVGAVAGFAASHLMTGHGYGILADILVGIIGAFIGVWLFTNVLHLAIGTGLLALIIMAFVGALILLFLLRLVGVGRRGGYGRRRI